jgi:hypothetical protein
MPRAEDESGLHVTVPVRTYEYLKYLIKIRGTNLGRTPTGVATTMVTRELNSMMKKGPLRTLLEAGRGAASRRLTPEMTRETFSIRS